MGGASLLWLVRCPGLRWPPCTPACSGVKTLLNQLSTLWGVPDSLYPDGPAVGGCVPVNPQVSAAAALCPDGSLPRFQPRGRPCSLSRTDLSSFLVRHGFVPEALRFGRCARWSWETSQARGGLTRPTPHPTGSLGRKEMKPGLSGW